MNLTESIILSYMLGVAILSFGLGVLVCGLWEVVKRNRHIDWKYDHDLERYTSDRIWKAKDD